MSSKPPKKGKKPDFSKVKSGSSTYKGKSARDREIDKRLAGAISDADMDKLRREAKSKNKKVSPKDEKKAAQKKKNSEMQDARAKRKKTLKELRGG